MFPTVNVCHLKTIQKASWDPTKMAESYKHYQRGLCYDAQREKNSWCIYISVLKGKSSMWPLGAL